MRPTFSIIAFTVLSGLGYGLWFVVGVGLALHGPACGARSPPSGSGMTLQLCRFPDLFGYALGVGFVLATAGLLASLGHLGKPFRTWRALSQWRSSWLSREGIAALVAYVPAVALAAVSLATADDPWAGIAWLRAIGAVLALASVATVYCTAHIYSSLKPIPAWHNAYVMPSYLALALAGGALGAWALSTLPYALAGDAFERGIERGLVFGTLAVALVAGALIKLRYWRLIDAMPLPGPGHATGLDALGNVRVFEAPHTEENYLTHEMGFVLARKHRLKLRRIALITGFVAPLVLAIIAFAWTPANVAAAWLALASGLAGLFVERWLFFAEARHAVIAYYGH